MTLFDLSCAVDEVSVCFDVTRYLASPMINGRAQDVPKELKFTIRGSIQPVTGAELKNLPEGMRAEAVVKVYTPTQLFTVRQSDTKIPDRFDYRGDQYQVEKVEDWHDLGNYYKVIAVRTNR